ncbi:hypothetical protein GALMADRAFT_141121 [Galerina marginata CBS 339.88]|uniref:Uncharacterized protein n=1 Tax=Galerina marginata (strain CBS 339.88) TaxID=685588 RepID=A0A067SV18_GALM3|nr:hypothetical protein GALMADRAFT_141121 [Galerina marginata CBS 339.88]
MHKPQAGIAIFTSPPFLPAASPRTRVLLLASILLAHPITAFGPTHNLASCAAHQLSHARPVQPRRPFDVRLSRRRRLRLTRARLAKKTGVIVGLLSEVPGPLENASFHGTLQRQLLLTPLAAPALARSRSSGISIDFRPPPLLPTCPLEKRNS